MGVRGFTTYMSHHSHLFLETFELKNCYLVIDGSGIAIHLYQWHTRANDCFGGDYDNYANTVNNFFSLLKKSCVTPIVLFDGGYENRKLKTVFSRMRNRVGAINRLNSATEGSICVFPLFIKELFQDIALNLGVKCIRNDYESDSEIACLARNLNCPILGYDSDFYFFDTLYIPFTKFEMKVLNAYNKELKRSEPYIPCEVYKIEKFLKYFGGLDKVNLPLLPVLLGNDYVKKSMFSAFYRHIKLKKFKAGNEQQRLIKTVIYWLRHETLESAISKILGRFKERRRKFICSKLNDAMQGYLQVNSSLIGYLEDTVQSSVCRRKEFDFDILKIKPKFDEEQLEDEFEESSNEISFEESDEENEGEIIEVIKELENLSSNDCKGPKKIEDDLGCNSYFSERYRRCCLPQCFVDIKMRHSYFCISQVEDYSESHSHTISLHILNCIHKILTQPCKSNLVCIARGGGKTVKKERLPNCTECLPKFEDIQNFTKDESKECFFRILNIDKSFQKLLDLFPSDWHLFLISLYYWKSNSCKKVDTSFIYSLVLCSIVLNFIDSQVGFCRSLKTFYKKYNNSIVEIEKVKSKTSFTTESIKSSLQNIDYNESLLCLKILLNYFHMEPKMSVNNRLYDVTVVGQFSQFQSCLLHIKYLNSILNFPFENILISNFFNGTFLYNSTINFRKRTNLKCYIATLLKDCTIVSHSFQMIMECINNWFGGICDSDAKKTRKRKRKPKLEEREEIREHLSNEEDFIDEANKYSLLQNVNSTDI